MKSSYLITVFSFAAILYAASCTQEEILEPQSEKAAFAIVGNPVQVHLGIAVSGLNFGVGTRAEEPVSDYDGEDSEEERHVDDLWLFEYSQSSGELIYMPQQVTINSQEELTDIEVTLSDNNGKPAVIYVVTNSGSGVSENSVAWVAEEAVGSDISYPGFMTIEDLEANTIPTPHPQRMTWNESKETYVLDAQDADAVSIPMAGYIEDVTVKEDAEILVPVVRMFAKLLVRVDLSGFNTEEYTSAWLSTVTVGNIPEYCRVGTLWDGDRGDSATPANYSACERWIQRTFNAVGESSSDTDGTGNDDDAVYPYLIYVPENIQGESGSSTDKTDNVPNDYALTVTAGIYVETNSGAMLGEYTSFVAYPGGNSTTNFNVRRNCLYRVTMRINDLIDDVLPSANCIVCFSGETTAFYPYCRTETGGGYKFEDYLDAYGDESKKISYVKIIWQSTDGGNTVDYDENATGGYIGNNSGNDYVWIDTVGVDATDEYHRRIHVSIPDGRTGNALIGAYNSNGDIIWSWHIWSRARENDPTTVNTKLYYTYDWDEDGIYDKNSGRPRVAGYTIMNSNLGAMQDEPTSYSTFDGSLVTYGTYYQWGRKDPFPATIVSLRAGSTYTTEFTNASVGNYFDNEDNSVTIVGTDDTSALFHSVSGSERKVFDEMIPLTIQNPTVFYCGTIEVNTQGALPSSKEADWSAYPEPGDGNWLLDGERDHFNRLWGGLDPELDGGLITKKFVTSEDYNITEWGYVTLYDDYGEKSIFDPCPYGWRVSPPDLWLGFSNTGLNPRSFSTTYVNYNTSLSSDYGMTMYLTDWLNGETTYFPIQGARAPGGLLMRSGRCGNYHDATAQANDIVNVLHIHNSSDFKIFETALTQFMLKSNASSIRCVRIDSVQQ